MRAVLYSLVVITYFAATAWSQVVVNGDISWSANSDVPNANYRGWIAQYPDQHGTSVWFKYASDFFLGQFSLKAIATNLDEGSEWYIVPEGIAFTRQAIQEKQFPVLIDLSTSIDRPAQSIPSSGDFYLGVRTGRGYFNADAWDIYGWVKLRSTGFELQMLTNACAYGVSGIVVGTTQTIPEPATMGVIGFAVVTFIFFARRNRR